MLKIEIERFTFSFLTALRSRQQNRSKDVAYPRQMAMYMIRQELEYSFPDIAKIFKRDHTTVMHACNKIEEERKNSRETEDVIKKLHNNIRGDG